MTATPSSTSRRRRLAARVLSVAILLTASALVVNCDLIVPREGWNEQWGPLVPHGKFPGKCELCHVPEGWEVLRPDFAFDHAKETGTPLNGAHAIAACLRCHNDRGPVEAYVARGCGGCHVDPHKADQGLDCARCHNERSWRPIGLVAEHARTRFPLVGTHSVVSCEACHDQASVGDYRGAPVLCELCHQADLQQTSAPDHLANGLVSNCGGCHTPRQWQSGAFTHDFFPLIGGHDGVLCSQCHRGGRVSGLSMNCYKCHEADYLGAPNHVALNFPTDCTQCHSIVAWRP